MRLHRLLLLYVRQAAAMHGEVHTSVGHCFVVGKLSLRASARLALSRYCSTTVVHTLHVIAAALGVIPMAATCQSW
jgi:hypothetical protein